MKYLFIFLFFLLSVVAKAQWQRIPTLSGGGELIDGVIFDAQRMAVISRNASSYTTDGGATWNRSFIPETPGFVLAKLIKISDVKGIASGKSVNGQGLLIQTLDAGKNWTILARIPVTSVSRIQFVSADTGFIQCEPNSFWKTVDGGHNWVRMIMPDGLEQFVRGVDFFDGNRGYLYMNKNSGPPNYNTNAFRLYKTTNGGQSWIMTRDFSGATLDYISTLKTLAPDRLVFGSIYPEKLYLSVDGGVSDIQVVSEAELPYNSESRWFKDGPNSWTYYRAGCYPSLGYNSCKTRVHRTTNNGVTWQTQQSIGCDRNVVSTLPPISSTHLEVGENGKIVLFDRKTGSRYYLSHGVTSANMTPLENGEVRMVGNSGVAFFNSQFTHSRFKWVLDPCWDYNYYDQGLYCFANTVGGGYLFSHFWQPTFNSNGFTNYVEYLDSLNGNYYWLGFQRKDVLFLKDSALAAWYLPRDSVIHFTHFPDTVQFQRPLPANLDTLSNPVALPIGGTAYLLANLGKVYKTNDGAQSWTTTQYPAEFGAIRKFHFQNAQLGFAVGQHISRTTDGGQTWTLVDTNHYNHSNWTFHFINDSLGFAFGDTLLKTSDGGLSWFPVPNVPVSSREEGYSQMVFNEAGEGIVYRMPSSTLYYYHPVSDSWNKEAGPESFFFRFTYDPFGQRWLCPGYSGDMLVRTGQPYNAISEMVVTERQLCLGDSLQIQTRFRNIQSPRQVTIEMSDAQGTFGSPTILGSIQLDSTDENVLQSLAFALPSSLQTGSGFRVRLVGGIEFQPSDVYHQFQILAVPQAQAGNDLVLCQYSTGNIFGTPAYGIWISDILNVDGSLTSSNEPGVYPAVYQVSVSSTCFSRDTIQITLQASPEPDSIRIQNGFLVGHSATGYFLQWMKDGQSVVNANDSSLLIQGPGAYWLEVRGGNGCASQSNIVLITGRKEDLSSNQLLVFPNPAQGQLHVVTAEGGQFILYNELGAAVRQFQLEGGEENVLSTDGLPTGIYHLKAQSATGVQMRKVMVGR